MRKVFVAVPTKRGPTRESLWAEVVGPDTARIQNIPFLTDKVGFHDIVRLDELGNVLEILERTTRTRWARYDPAPDRQQAERGYKETCDYLRQSNIECESAVPGMFSMAVPQDVSDLDLVALCQGCPLSPTVCH
jgi:hypothetical protein